MRLDPDATLRSVISSLLDPDDFVSRAFGVVHVATKEHGSVLMRLGVTGTGKLPNYRLDSAATGQPIVAIDGNNHAPWAGPSDISRPDNWSTATMTKGEIEALLGELRNFKRKE